MVCSFSTLFWAKWASDTGQEIMHSVRSHNGQGKEHMHDLVMTVVDRSVKMDLRQIRLGNGICFFIVCNDYT